MDKAIQFFKKGYSKGLEVKPEDLLPKEEKTKDLPATKSILTVIAEGYKSQEK